MSRTRKTKRSPGSEYWSKRPGTKKSNSPGKFSKKLNASLERLEAKKIIRKEMDE